MNFRNLFEMHIQAKLFEDFDVNGSLVVILGALFKFKSEQGM